MKPACLLAWGRWGPTSLVGWAEVVRLAGVLGGVALLVPSVWSQSKPNRPETIQARSAMTEPAASGEARSSVPRLALPSARKVGSTVPAGDEVPLTLADVIARALESNLDLAVQAVGPDVAAANLEQARGTFDPRFNAGLRYGERISPRSAEQQAADQINEVERRTTSANLGVSQQTALGTNVSLLARTTNNQDTFNLFENEFNTFAGLEVRQPLLKNAGTEANLAQIRIARRGMDRAQFQFLDEVESLVLRAHEAYYFLMFALKDVEAKRQSLDLAEKLLADNQARVELGVMTPLDVSQARAEVGTRRSALLAAQQQAREAENAVKALVTGEVLAWLAKTIVPIEVVAPPRAPPPLMADIQEALRNRNDLQAALAQLAAQNIQVRFRQNQTLPQLDLLGNVGKASLRRDLGDGMGDLFDRNFVDWFVGFTVEVPWGNRLEEGRLTVAQLEAQRSLLELRRLEQRIILEVDNLSKRTSTDLAQIETTRTARIFADESVRAEEERLKEGATTSFVVLQLQRDLAESRTRELRALADYYTTLARLQRAKGTLLPASRIQVEFSGEPPVRSNVEEASSRP